MVAVEDDAADEVVEEDSAADLAPEEVVFQEDVRQGRAPRRKGRKRRGKR